MNRSAILTPNMFHFIRGDRRLRRYHLALAERLRSDASVRLLPGLETLLPENLGLPPLAELRDLQAPLTLLGAQGSGRTLLLQRLASQWIDSKASTPVVLLSLARIDRPSLPPRAVLASVLHEIGLPSPLGEGRIPIAARRWLLLFDDWEALDPERRAAWRSCIERLPQQWPEALIVVALPPTERWAGVHQHDVAALDDQQIAYLLQTLLPRYEIGDLLIALRPSGALGALRERVADLVLLALVYPLSGLPSSVSALYDQARALVVPVRAPDPAHRERDDAVRSTAFEPIVPPLPTPGDALLRTYEHALDLVTRDTAAMLAALHDRDMDMMLPLLAALVPDPAPLYEHVWARAERSAAYLLVLARCIAERPTSAPAWGRRLASTLAQESASEQVLVARAVIEPVLPLLLDDRDTQSFALFADTAWPSSRVLLTLLDDTSLLASLRWAAADALCRRVPPLKLLTAEARIQDSGLRRTGASDDPSLADNLVCAETPSEQAATLDALSRAARAYIIATAVPEEHRQLALPEFRSWVRALLGEAIDSTRRSAALTALVHNDDAPESLRVLLLPYLALRRSTTDATLLSRACADPSREVRSAALAALAALPAPAALQLLAQLIADTTPSSDRLADWLAALARMPQGEASGLIVRCVLDQRLSLESRHRALELLARRQQAATLVLPRLIAAADLDPLLRAAACTFSAQLAPEAVFKPLQSLLLCAPTALLQRAALQTFVAFAVDTRYRDAVVATVLHLLASPTIDDTLLAIALRALGNYNTPAALAALGNLVRRGHAHELRAAWLDQSADLALLAPARWETLDLGRAAREVLAAHLTIGATAADPPGSLEELVANQDELLRAEAAAALVKLAGDDALTRRAVRADIRFALRSAPMPTLARRLLALLAALSDDDGATELAEALADGALDAGTRWLAIECLGSHSSALAPMLRYLESGVLDSFNAGRLIAAVGQHGNVQALPALRRLADNHTIELYLRICAVRALGQLEASAAVAILMPIGSDTSAPLPLRAAAIASLPAALDTTVRRTLRDMLRQERQQTELVAAAARSLGRAGDREALPLLLRYAQSERNDEALAAIQALVDIGDATVVPVLVHVSQSALVAAAVRLRAVEALLQLADDDYLPLLQSYLDSRQPALREQAYAVLAAHDPGDLRLRTPLVDMEAPLALRLQAITVLGIERPGDPVLLAILEADEEPMQLRLLAAAALAHGHDHAVQQRLLAIITDIATPSLLARRCFESFTANADTTSYAALYQLAAASDLPAERRFWASERILQMRSGPCQYVF